jgi:branched-subunit amino acid aminotransferase/4-amino-4-deoxychorismate lyase
VPEYLLYNSQLIKEQDFRLSYTNRGFQYNDGFFDTLIYTNNRIRFLQDHLDRMQRACHVLGLQAPTLLHQAENLSRAITNLIQKSETAAPVVRVKINVWRQAGGLFTPDLEEAEILISVAPQTSFSPFIRQADFYAGLPNRFTPFSFFKGPNALHYVQAGLVKKKAGLDEIILLDEQGNISECLAANLFWIKNNQVFTPALETGCIAGIMRLNILRACQMLRLEVQEGFFKQSDLLAADFIFTSNVTGLRPILALSGLNFADQHPLLSALEKLVLA